ncbi:hypothetical protein, partial [Fulvimonas soli]|uniref:hypothetical protein n=1 Tax=Fulvimonas soli TaxID=155197 RepID=UPI001B87D20F
LKAGGCRSRTIWAAASGLFGIIVMIVSPSLAHGLLMSGMLLFAWDLAFVSNPSARKPLNHIYKDFRSGHHARGYTAQLVGLASIVLMLASFFVDR